MIPIASKDEAQKLRAQYSHESFMQYCWQKPREKLLVGMHTREICRLIDQAMDNFRRNISTYLIIKVPFRHGKSDIISRYLPPHFLGEFPDSEVMVVTYASDLAEGFSRFARGIMTSDSYRSLYPKIKLDKKNGGVKEWGIEEHLGKCSASGLTSGITGKGATLAILDDYCAGRADAESSVIRNSQWEHFKDDFMTRLAPCCICIILATPWHTDDIIARVQNKLDPNHKDYDPNYPPFKVVTFPAMDGDVEIGVKDPAKYGDRKYHMERRKYKWLFPERFSESWYLQKFATLGSYSAAALLQCNPVIRGGNQINTSRIKLHYNEAEFPEVRFTRVWDLAHTAKQTQKADPDYTSGTLLAYTLNNDGTWSLWIKHVARIRAKAPERDNFIRAVTEHDGAGVPVAIEYSSDAIDAYNKMEEILRGRRSVIAVKCKGDKVARTAYIEPIFEVGNVHILAGDWNFDWLAEVSGFPNWNHDDQVDNLTCGYVLYCTPKQEATAGDVSGI